MNELYEHKKSDAVKWAVVFILIAILMLGTVASLILSLGKKDKPEEPTENTGNLAVSTVANSPGIKLYHT